MSRFAGRTAVVTGGSSGLGLAISARLVADGARVCVWDSVADVAERCAASLPGAGAMRVDVSDEAGVQAAADRTMSSLGSVSILVNNAGISGPHATVCDLSLADWNRVIAVNLTGAFLCCRALIPAMAHSGWGRVVNISSVSGKEGNAEIAAYAASKAGLISLTKTLGKELAATAIRVNCITPGAIRTAIFDQWPEDYVAGLVAKIPMGRFGLPEELAAMVAWLCSDEASFSTGAVFDLSGGRATY